MDDQHFDLYFSPLHCLEQNILYHTEKCDYMVNQIMLLIMCINTPVANLGLKSFIQRELFLKICKSSKDLLLKVCGGDYICANMLLLAVACHGPPLSKVQYLILQMCLGKCLEKRASPEK